MTAMRTPKPTILRSRIILVASGLERTMWLNPNSRIARFSAFVSSTGVFALSIASCCLPMKSAHLEKSTPGT